MNKIDRAAVMVCAGSDDESEEGLKLNTRRSEARGGGCRARANRKDRINKHLSRCQSLMVKLRAPG